MPAMALTLPITITVTAMVGVFVTTATLTMNNGVAQWNPLVLLISVQKETYTPLSRCATFFAGLAFLMSQIFVNLTQNTIPYGMDLAGMLPRYLTNRRASTILVVLTCIVQPWRFLSQASIFITVLSCFSRKY
jgi:NCS1 family nucleobase:cation symporter-1